MFVNSAKGTIIYSVCVHVRHFLPFIWIGIPEREAQGRSRGWSVSKPLTSYPIYLKFSVNAEILSRKSRTKSKLCPTFAIIPSSQKLDAARKILIEEVTSNIQCKTKMYLAFPQKVSAVCWSSRLFIKFIISIFQAKG